MPTACQGEAPRREAGFAEERGRVKDRLHPHEMYDFANCYLKGQKHTKQLFARQRVHLVMSSLGTPATMVVVLGSLFPGKRSGRGVRSLLQNEAMICG
jgi:hypothetical protein